VEKGVFHQVAKFVDVSIVRALDDPVLSGRNHRLGSLRLGLRKDGVRIVAAIRHQMLRFYACDEGWSLRAISGGTFCDNNSERHTMRIHGQMNLGVEPPFVRLMA
jgi:hypothetical protein